MNARPESRSPRLRRGRIAAVLVLAGLGAAGVGCELVAEIDRSKIPGADASVADVASDNTTSGDATTDSPSTTDAGKDAGDAATNDASTTDASDGGGGGSDAGLDASDAGSDAGSDANEAGPDASDGAADDGGDAASDAADASDGAAIVNGCSPTDFAASDGGAAPTITFDNGNFTYAPKCLRVTVGTMVTFNGTFAAHPLHQYPADVTGSPLPPFAAPDNTGTTHTYTFAAAGVYGYSCSLHESLGMTGAIEVVP